MKEQYKKFLTKNVPLLSLAIILAAGSAIGYYLYDKNQNKDSSKTSEWVEYKNEKYKIKFNHPKAWGKPNISERAAKTGKSYSINFPPFPAPQSLNIIPTVSVIFDSNDLELQVCDTVDPKLCSDIPAFTEKFIQDRLVADKSDLVDYDNHYYASITTEQIQNISSSLSIHQAVKLPFLNTSAVRGSYTIHSDVKDCSKDNFSPPMKAGCIAKDDYKTFKKMIDSIRPL